MTQVWKITILNSYIKNAYSIFMGHVFQSYGKQPEAIGYHNYIIPSTVHTIISTPQKTSWIAIYAPEGTSTVPTSKMFNQKIK